MPTITSATQIFALAHEIQCEGEDRCHWCGSPAKRLWVHDDPAPVPGSRRTVPCRNPAGCYLCSGCLVFRRKRVTVNFLTGGYKDSQAPITHSWIVTPQGAWAIRREDYGMLWERLRKPPPVFALSLLEHEPTNLLHVNPWNEIAKVEPTTTLHFALDNKPLAYTIYELEEGIKNGAEGTQPGVHALLRLLKPPKLAPEKPQEEKRGVGRPKNDPGPLPTKKPVEMKMMLSGQALS